MARQAGKLLAELRRASNEFRSQIETEIAHIEVRERDAENKKISLPPPPGAVASLSVNPASDTIPHRPESTATLAAPTVEAPPVQSPVAVTATAPDSSTPPTDSAVPTSQESHV